MEQLLEQVLSAHGGMDIWKSVTGLTVRMSLGGPFWAGRGWPGAYEDTSVHIDTRRQDITFTPGTTTGLRSHFTTAPEVIRILDTGGTVTDERLDPRPGFPPFTVSVPWDAVQTAYFTSCAVWPYLTEPFLLTWPGVLVKEIEPWTEGDQTWRRLAVTFPDSIRNHNPQQTFYFDERFHQRRMDYQPDVTGAAIAHYIDDSREFGGLLFPTRRAIHPRRPDGTANRDITPITLAVHDVTVHRD